jgi:hypothetical protein
MNLFDSPKKEKVRERRDNSMSSNEENNTFGPPEKDRLHNLASRTIVLVHSLFPFSRIFLLI